MFSIQVKLLIIVVFIGSLVIFFLQNTQSVPLILFGSTIATLSVGIWILIAIFSGILTSLILQLFNQAKTKIYPQVYPEPTNRNTSNYSRSPRPPRQDERPFTPTERRSPVTNIKQEQKVKESPPTQIQDNINKSVSEPETSENKQDSVKKDTVYSYSYRQSKDKGVNKTDNIYDANYRVIMPPYQANEEESLDDKNEDEDWV